MGMGITEPKKAVGAAPGGSFLIRDQHLSVNTAGKTKLCMAAKSLSTFSPEWLLLPVPA